MKLRHQLALAAIPLALVTGALAWQGASGNRARAADAPTQAAVSPPAELVPLAAPKYLGTRSCAATACHGSAEPDRRAGRIGRNEYVFWFEHDPHARAYRALSAPRGQEILARLGITSAGKVVDEAGYGNCLACHNVEPPAGERGENFFATEGVGCEACHGGAEHWIADHQRGPLTPAQKRALGMRDTADFAVRAELCVKCHVGSETSDVNHDLLAAGHPPLKFELAAYCEIYPKHWNDQAERRRTPDFELELWLQGHFATQDAALAVQMGRATRGAAKENSGPWPEFANYDCFACHHDLDGKQAWREATAANHDKVVWPAQRWYATTLATADEKIPALAPYLQQEHALRQTLEESLSPDPGRVLAAAAAARAAWRKVRNEWPTAALERRTALGQSLARKASDPALVADWDTATQNYLLLAAYERWRRDSAAQAGVAEASLAPRAALLAQLRTQLAFPPHYNSPKQFAAPLDQGQSPRAEVRAKLRELLETLP